MTAEAVREQFEKWTLTRLPRLDLHRHTANGADLGDGYSNGVTHHAWEAWQAALSTQPQPDLEEFKAAANLLIDYCQAHDWGTMPEPFASINPFLKLLGREEYKK